MANFTFSLSDAVPDYMKTPAEPKPSEARLIGEQAIEGPLRETVASLPWAQAATGFAPLFGYPTGYDVTSEQALTAARQGLGISGQEPNTMLGRAAGAGARALTSPSTYYTAPLFGMTNQLANVSGAVGGAAGAQIGEELGGTGGAIAGGLLGGSLSMLSPLNLAMSSKDLYSNIRNNAGPATESLVSLAGNKRAAGIAQKAFEADPELAANLLRATEIERLTGVKLPTTAASQGSNVLLQETRSQAAQTPEFLAELRRQESNAKVQILERAKKLFGMSSEERLAEAAKPVSATKSINKRLSDIDNELAAIGDRVDSVDPTALGNRITNLVKSKEELARKEVAPLYEDSLNKATAEGINLNPTQTERLYGFVNDSVNKDIFKTFPSIYSKINSKFAPEVLEDGTEVFKSASVRDLDSLKRGINEALRGNASQDTRRVLNNLKFELNNVVDELPASFKTSYRGADAEYLRKVGIPFEAKAIDDIGSKGFVEQTVPVLTKNPSALNQFLDIAGNEGKDIVRDSFMYDLSKVPNLIDANGAVNPKILDRFIAKNKDTLKIVPEIGDEIRGLSNDSRLLLNTQQRFNNMLKDEQKREANSLFTKINNQGLDATIGQFFTSPNQQKNIMSELNKNPEALKGFRAAVVENLTKSGNTLNYFNENKDAMNALFGPTYIKNVEALAEATQALYANPVKLNVPLKTGRKTKFEETLGMSPESTVALARRQITSPFQKITIGLSKFFQNKASQTEGEAIQQFLLDPKKIEEVAKAYKDMAAIDDPEKLKSLAAKTVKHFVGEAGKRAAFGSYLGLLNSVDYNQPVPSAQPPQQQEMQFRFMPPNPITQQ